MTTDASTLDKELLQVLQDLAVGATVRYGLAEWLAQHARRLASGNPSERGIIGDLYVALSDSEELHTDYYVRETAFSILEQLRSPQLWESSSGTLVVRLIENSGSITVTETADATERTQKQVMAV